MPLIDFSDVTGAESSPQRPERSHVDFSDVTGGATPQRLPVLRDWRGLKQFAEGEGFTVTSTTGGGHNVGSAHYAGRAVDVRTRDKRPEEIEGLMGRARAVGLIVRDERVRPKGQKVWGGPHVHLQVGSAQAPLPTIKQKPRAIDFSDVTAASGANL